MDTGTTLYPVVPVMVYPNVLWFCACRFHSTSQVTERHKVSGTNDDRCPYPRPSVGQIFDVTFGSHQQRQELQMEPSPSRIGDTVSLDFCLNMRYVYRCYGVRLTRRVLARVPMFGSDRLNPFSNKLPPCLFVSRTPNEGHVSS